ncbi:MAG: RecQ family ATP-dependent DNA helicase [Bacteroidetes bacterium]|nr:RecQ family ATP-dependent DNA helicase [Bacteroidota bacterium]
MDISDIPLQEKLQHYFGFKQFKGQQEVVIKNLLAGNNTFVIMPTGGGKSLCYQLPALISEGTAIVVSPLIALMKNQVDAIRNFSNEDGIAHFINSSLTKAEIAAVKTDLLSGKTKLLYLAPESLTKQENISFLNEIKISFFAIDEAHCISEWGHDFRPEYRRLKPIIEQIGNVPIIALTATATPKVQVDIQRNLGMMEAQVFKSSFNRPNLYYEVRPKKNAIKEIIKYVKQNTGKSGVIYCLSRKKVEELAETLKVNGVKAMPYHAGLDAATRARTQDLFLMEDIDVIVATIAFGMGIDKPDVRFVIHHDIPKSLEGYYQETGRAGRDGGEGNCIAFYTYDDIIKLEKFMKDKPVAEQEIGKQLLYEVVSFSESALCRRRFILHYFGESFEEADCNCMCDNCKNPKQRVEAQEDIVLALDSVLDVKEMLKSKDLICAILGMENSVTKAYKCHEQEFFGSGNEDGKDERYWSAIIRQALMMGLLSKEVENYGLLKITELGKEYLKAPYSVEIVKDHEYVSSFDDVDDSEIVDNAKANNSADEELFVMLKDLCRQIAKQKNLPPYVIFQESSLSEMTVQFPITIEELTKITGVGHGKAQKFGKPFIDLIAKYVEDNDIDRPQDFVVKSIVNKSGSKVHIIQSIDRKQRLDDIADAKNLSMTQLLDEIETIVMSGTKVNIGYYLDTEVDKDKQQEIIEYFKTSNSDSIQEALQELGADDFTEEEIRLVRIKFLSEYGN